MEQLTPATFLLMVSPIMYSLIALGGGWTRAAYYGSSQFTGLNPSISFPELSFLLQGASEIVFSYTMQGGISDDFISRYDVRILLRSY